MTAPVAVLVYRLGPIHVASIGAAAARYPTVAIELARESVTYAWDIIETTDFARVTIASEGTAEELPRYEFAKRLYRALSDVRPRAIVISGYHHFGSLFALAWGLRTGTPVVVTSDSQEIDSKRQWWKEHIKSRLVRLCSSAFVAGERHGAYMRKLGMPEDRVFLGYDVVDNAYFAGNAERVRRDAAAERARLGLPRHFFLASSRFIAKKNLPFLLRAYKRYRREQGELAFKLVVVGDGPMRPQLEALRSSLGLEADVFFPGFRQFPELPSYYGLAEAFVHASTVEQWGLVVNEAMASGLPVIVSDRCGCVPELVHAGENGYTFSPNDEVALSDLLRRIAADDQGRKAMGLASSARIARLSPAVFAAQLECAITSATVQEHRRARAADWVLLAALAFSSLSNSGASKS